jgi:benzylsuccinate CoA-transferase BbsF subunit
VLAALLHRRRTGEGQYIDLSQWEAVLAVMPEALMERTMNEREPERMGNRDPYRSPQGCFRCAGNDEWVSLSVRSDAEWRALAAEMGQAALGTDERFATLPLRKANEDELEALIGRWTVGLDKWDVTRRLQARSIPAFPSMTVKDLVEDEHLSAREFFQPVDHPLLGRQKYPSVGWRYGEEAQPTPGPAPVLDGDTERVLEEIAGLSKSEIAKLRASGVLG